jgi:hypothetical protein
MKRTKAPPPKKSLSLNELAREQGVSPVKDIQEISDLWPVDDDPNCFVSSLWSAEHADND